MTIHNGFAGLATNGNDILYGRAVDFGVSPAPALVGGVDDSPDTINGLGGNDIIVGDLFNQTDGYEADTINGDDGDDWLFGDTVDFSFSDLIAVFGPLSDIVLTLDDGTALNITDDLNWLTRVLTGANDDLHGGNDNDHLFGSGGADILRGDAGNDYLDGGTGQDDMNGGTGADTYIVDNNNDTVSELSGDGIDLVLTAISYSLDKFVASNTFLVENITAQGSDAISLTGNVLANILNGADNGAANSLTGLGGNDTYILGLGDTVSETGGTSGGIDRVQSGERSLSLSSFASVEQATLTGSAALNLTGSTAANTLAGNAGSNIINGGAGKDTLAGGTGSDYFVFANAPSATSNKDIITDYNVAADTIRLENGVFTKIAGSSQSFLSSVQFYKSTSATKAHDLNDRIIYNTKTGALYYDADGNKAGGVGAIHFATLSGSPDSLSRLDFFII